MKDNSKKSDRLEIRISPKEEMMIKQKAENFNSITSMLLSAVQQFDDTGTKRKIEKLNEMVALYQKSQQELSWLSGNLSQVINRACELTPPEEQILTFFTDILFPQIDELQELIKDIKDEQHQVVKKLTR